MRLIDGEEEPAAGDEEDEDRPVRRAAQRVELAHEAGQDAVGREPREEADDAHVGREDGAREHDDGVDADKGLQRRAADGEANDGEQIAGVLIDHGHGHDHHRAEREQRIVDGDEDPQVAQGVDVDAVVLHLLDKIGRRLEPRDAQRRQAVAKVERRARIADDDERAGGRVEDVGEGLPPVGGEEDPGILEGVDDRGDDERRHHREVQRKHEHGDECGLADAEHGERGEGGEEDDGARADVERGPEDGEVLHAVDARDDGGRNVRDHGQHGGHGGHALGRDVQQPIVRAAVDGQRRDDLRVREPVAPEQHREQRQAHGSERPRHRSHRAARVEARGQQIVARDGRAQHLAQANVPLLERGPPRVAQGLGLRERDQPAFCVRYHGHLLLDAEEKLGHGGGLPALALLCAANA